MESIAINHCIDIEAGTADKKWSALTGEDVINGFISQPLEIGQGKKVIRVSHVKKVVGNPLHLVSYFTVCDKIN